MISVVFWFISSKQDKRSPETRVKQSSETTPTIWNAKYLKGLYLNM